MPRAASLVGLVFLGAAAACFTGGVVHPNAIACDSDTACPSGLCLDGFCVPGGHRADGEDAGEDGGGEETGSNQNDDTGGGDGETSDSGPGDGGLDDTGTDGGADADGDDTTGDADTGADGTGTGGADDTGTSGGQASDTGTTGTVPCDPSDPAMETQPGVGDRVGEPCCTTYDSCDGKDVMGSLPSASDTGDLLVCVDGVWVVDNTDCEEECENNPNAQGYLGCFWDTDYTAFRPLCGCY